MESGSPGGTAELIKQVWLDGGYIMFQPVSGPTPTRPHNINVSIEEQVDQLQPLQLC